MHTQWAEAAQFRPPNRATLAQAITDDLRRRIVSGELAQHRKLPSVRKLAYLYGVSVPTVGSALHALAALGFVRKSPGVGTFVSGPRDHTALLNYVWRAASTAELAILRAAIDERSAVILVNRVVTLPRVRLPRTLDDINFFVHERSINRRSDPELFLRADLAFHRTILASLRGIEIGPVLYERIGERLLPALMGVADLQATDERLDHDHLALAAAILDGRVAAVIRLARAVAGQELQSLDSSLG